LFCLLFYLHLRTLRIIWLTSSVFWPWA
jgi:hypothetical protein